MVNVEKILLEFASTLDISLKKIQKDIGNGSVISRLTINQLQYIEAIYELENPTITEIAEKLEITKASVTTAINKLSQLGYVTKTQSTEDKRIFHVCLTEASDKLMKAKSQASKEYVEFIYSALGKDEARQFEKTLTKLVKLFDQS
jgi:DNA-binding MarR family transcriptional regulator